MFIAQPKGRLFVALLILPSLVLLLLPSFLMQLLVFADGTPYPNADHD